MYLNDLLGNQQVKTTLIQKPINCPFSSSMDNLGSLVKEKDQNENTL